MSPPTKVSHQIISTGSPALLRNVWMLLKCFVNPTGAFVSMFQRDFKEFIELLNNHGNEDQGKALLTEVERLKNQK